MYLLAVTHLQFLQSTVPVSSHSGHQKCLVGVKDGERDIYGGISNVPQIRRRHDTELSLWSRFVP